MQQLARISTESEPEKKFKTPDSKSEHGSHSLKKNIGNLRIHADNIQTNWVSEFLIAFFSLFTL